MTDVKNLKVYIIAGEPSGDLLGSRFMRAMVKKTNGQVEFYGVGGESMEKAGLKSLFDISDLAIMGLAEVIPSIPKVLRLIKQTVADIEKVKPDVVITIDSLEFRFPGAENSAPQKTRHSAGALCGAAGLGLEKETGADDV